MWELYDGLIDRIPDKLQVKAVVAGSFWTCVESELGAGVAITGEYLARPACGSGKLTGMRLKDAARLAKSWNLVEAAIGVAAINAYYNVPDTAAANGVMLPGGSEDDRLNDPYIAYRNHAKGKRVAGVGHSQYLSSLMGNICELTLIGGDEPGNYPITATDELLPGQDFVFLPCTGIVDKSLPGLLRQCGGKVIVCGPSIPMAPLLHEYGVYDLSGFIVTDSSKAMEAAGGSRIQEMFLSGKKVSKKQIISNRKEDGAYHTH